MRAAAQIPRGKGRILTAPPCRLRACRSLYRFVCACASTYLGVCVCVYVYVYVSERVSAYVRVCVCVCSYARADIYRATLPPARVREPRGVCLAPIMAPGSESRPRIFGARGTLYT